jgi:hypothetical protein
MSKYRDRGYDYLTSSGDEFEFDLNNDGSWGYENEDGTGSYYGADGSWGYKYSDGSASYYGADGSWGYKNSDGSVTYYEAHDSCINTDTDENVQYYYSDIQNDDGDEEDEEDDDNDNLSPAGTAAAAAIGVGLATYAIINNHKAVKRKEEEDRIAKENAITAEKKQLKKAKRKARFKRMNSRIFHNKMIDINISSDECKGRNYMRLSDIFKNNGFTNIKIDVIEDLEYDKLIEENLVTDVLVDGKNDFASTDKVKYNTEIILTVHNLRKVYPPLTYKQGKKLLADDVVELFENAGFVDIRRNPIKDLKLGILKKDGKIDSIKVAGKEKYKIETMYRINTPIEITYHTFK